MTMYHPCSKEFQENAKRLGLSGNQYIQRLRQEKKLVDPTEVERRRIDDLSKRLGYKDNAERARIKNWNKGTSCPMSENDDCTSYLGVYIGENLAELILRDIFGGISDRMLYKHPYYEYVVKGGYKVNVKTATLSNNRWCFHIGNNSITDYFLLIAFGKRENLDLIYIWLIGKGEIVRKGTKNGGYEMEKLYRRENIHIYDNLESPMSFVYFERYMIDNLEKYMYCCDDLKDGKSQFV